MKTSGSSGMFIQEQGQLHQHLKISRLIKGTNQGLIGYYK
jgi:hypothetical protein